jgi:hypothetical protein
VPDPAPSVPVVPSGEWVRAINLTVPPAPPSAVRKPEPRLPLHGAWIGYCWACGLMARVERHATCPPPAKLADRTFTLFCRCDCSWRETDPVYLAAANLPIPD